MKQQKADKSSFAGTEVQQSTKDDVFSVSQPNANTIVVGSRKIKFRAWDIIEKCFVKLNGLLFHTNEAVVELHGINTIVDLDKLILNQFTGYIDWNGKEIYDGDIITSPNGQIKKALIYYSHSSFWYKEWVDELKNWHNSELGWCEQYGDLKLGILHWSANRIALEVIGNVFESCEFEKEFLDNKCQHEGCYLEATHDGFCGAHCSCVV